MESDQERKLELFRVLVEEARDYAIFTLSARGQITSWNEGGHRLKGYTAQEAIGRHFSMFYSPEDRAAGMPDRALAIAAEEGRWESEGWRLRKDGSRFWAQVLITALRNSKGELIGYSKLTRDLSERRKKEEDLRRSERRMAVVLRSMGDALIATDGQGRVERMNPTAEHLTGWTQTDARGLPLDTVFNIINEDTRRTVESPVARVLREGVVVGLANHTLLISKSGLERPIADSAAPIRDDSGQVSGVVLIFHDQSEARDAERRLQKSEQRLRLLVESVEEYAIFMLSPDGFVESWNSGAQRIKGYRADEIIGQHFSRFYPPEDVEAGRPAQALAQAAQLGKFETEGWRVRKDGSRFWGSVVLSAVRDPDGKLRGFAKITRDLTDRQLEQRLRVQTERLNAVLEGVEEGILLQDPNGQLVYANQPAARMCGEADVTALLALPPGALGERFEIFDEENHALPMQALPGRLALAQSGRFERLLHVRDRRNGRSWWSLVRATPVLGADGTPAAVVNIWRDVTAERRREEMLRFLKQAGEVLASDLDYEKTLQHVAQLVVPKLADWCAVQVLEDDELRTLAVAHVNPDKVAMAAELNRRYPPRRDPDQGVYKVIATGRPEFYPEIPDELLRATAVDEEHWRIIRELGLRSAIIAPLSARGRVLGAITFIAAESGRIYDQNDLLVAEDLGRQAGLAVDNARLYSDATSAVRVRDDFLSIAGHELKTPLAALELQLQGLERAAKRGTLTADSRLPERLAKAAANGLRLENLINELLDVSRISAGRLRVEPAPFDLVELIHEVAERFADELSDAGCALRLDVRGPLVGSWDRLRIDQVLTNLISNAVKYGRGRPIDLGASAEGGRARIVVRDHGIGVAAADQARIFGRFERAVSQRNYGGIGLGLWIVRQIVEAHGGTIALESSPGAGATFTVDLPL